MREKSGFLLMSHPLLFPYLFASLLLTLQVIQGVDRESEDYRRCFEMKDHFPGCDPTTDPPDKKCYTTRSEPSWIPSPAAEASEKDSSSSKSRDKDHHLPFGCHMAPCSTQNEAFWLGMFAYEDFEHFLVKPPTRYQKESKNGKGPKEPFRREFVKALNQYWRRFKRMYTDEDTQIPEEYVQRVKIPDYIHRAKLYKPVDPDKPDDAEVETEELGESEEVVPLICDPRSYLICDHSYEVNEEYRRMQPLNLQKEPDEDYQLIGRCNCHPLYSKRGDQEQVPVPDIIPARSHPIHPKIPCLGRANVPCEFARWVNREGPHLLHNLTDTPPHDYADQTAVGYTTILPPNEDQLAHFFVPEDFHERILVDVDKNKNKVKGRDKDKEVKVEKEIKWVSRNTRCVPEASCEYFRSMAEMESFRRGEMWQGYGFHPVVRDMMLHTATKICRCKDREGWSYSGMHVCIKKE